MADGKREASRNRILDSARSVFFESGFERANLDEVARRAGIAKGTIYRYFDSKGELYVEVLARNSEIFVQRMDAAIDTSGTAAERLRRISDFYFDHYTANADYFRIFWAIENQSVIGELPAELVAQVSEVWRRSLAHLETVISDGVEAGEFIECDTWEVANTLWVMANAMIQAHAGGVRHDIFERDVRKMFGNALEIYLRGLCRR